MKTNDNFKKARILALLLAIGMPSQVAHAEVDALLADTDAVLGNDTLVASDSVLNSTTINIDGDFNARPQPSQADLLERKRKALEKANQAMVKKRIEDMRMDAEKQLTNKLHRAFNGGLRPVDTVRTGRAAPVRTAVAKAVIADKLIKNNKAIINLGMNTMDGTGVDVSDSFKGGLSFESLVHRQVSIGVGVSYNKMSARDTADRSIDIRGREVDYKRLSFEANSKYYLTVGSMVKPYVGAGVAYNRSSVEYTQTNFDYYGYGYSNYNYNPVYPVANQAYEDANKVNFNTMSASAILGAEIGIAKSFAMSLDFRYSRDFTSGVDSEYYDYKSQDQQQLENIAANIEETDQLSINAGVIFKF